RMMGPIRGLQNAFRQVQGRDNDASVVIFDGSDLGEMQAGFNAMTSGLRERERIRDLFGRHVGQDVSDVAMLLSEYPPVQQLDGPERTVGVLFVDIVGSTTLATQRSAVEVVSLLSRFFDVIVTAVEREQGLVNKFEGDAVLAVFGAPLPLADNAGAPL